MVNMKVDVIIPLYKPDKSLFEQIRRLRAQSVKINKIILINTEKAYFDELLKNEDRALADEKIQVIHIKKHEFDHGGTRRMAVEYSDAEIFVMLTQDAVPTDKRLIERLTEPLRKLTPKVAVSYGRQLAGRDSGILERYTRSFNYPKDSRIKSMADMERLGVKTFFCSNVCAAYNRDVYDRLGGFAERTIFNEDMIYAAAAIKAGYSIAYVAEARVLHSHNYSCKQQFQRNFDLGVSQAEHPEVFAGISSESEGKKLVIEATRHLIEHGRFAAIPYFYLQCASKYAGYLLGKKYRYLPEKVIMKCTTNKEYWNKER